MASEDDVVVDECLWLWFPADFALKDDDDVSPTLIVPPFPDSPDSPLSVTMVAELVVDVGRRTNTRCSWPICCC